MKKVLNCSLVLLLAVLCNNIQKAEAFKPFEDKKEVTKMEECTQVRASHLLVYTEEEAKKIREDIVSGKKTFAEAAQESSECPSRLQGGDLGFFGKGAMVKEFENAAFSLPVNEVSEPIKTQFGWHLIVVTDKK